MNDIVEELTKPGFDFFGFPVEGQVFIYFFRILVDGIYVQFINEYLPRLYVPYRYLKRTNLNPREKGLKALLILLVIPLLSTVDYVSKTSFTLVCINYFNIINKEPLPFILFDYNFPVDSTLYTLHKRYRDVMVINSLIGNTDASNRNIIKRGHEGFISLEEFIRPSKTLFQHNCEHFDRVSVLNTNPVKLVENIRKGYNKVQKAKNTIPEHVLEKQFRFRFIDFVTSRCRLNNIPMFDLYKSLFNKTFSITGPEGDYKMDYNATTFVLTRT